jgi:hypothetical protein
MILDTDFPWFLNGEEVEQSGGCAKPDIRNGHSE